MTKISQLSSIGDSLAIGDQFLIRDIDDTGSPNKSVTISGMTRALDTGTALAPALAFASDKNTGIYSPGADTLAFVEGGVEAMRIDSSGRVGIGTISPAVTLDLANVHGINNTVTRPFALRNHGQVSATGYGVGLSFYYPNGTTNDLGFEAASIDSSYTSGGNFGNLIFSTNNNAGVAERMRITSAGNVGIGAAGPTELLSINNSSSNAAILIRTGGASFNSVVKFNADDTNYAGIGLENTALVMRCSNSSTPTERARIDSSGRLLVGTPTAQGTSIVQVCGNSTASTDPGDLRIIRGVEVSSIGANVGAALGYIRFGTFEGAVGATIEAQSDATWSSTSDTPGRLVFSTTADGASSPTERMRINNAGNMLVGRTGTDGAALIQAPASSTVPSYGSATGVATAITHFEFRNPNGLVGTISTNASATAYNTSSDYRLKENVIAVTDGITRLQQLKPSRFNFIVDPDQTIDGFIAHEAQAIVPECVTGDKDAVDDDGNPVYQGIDQSKLVPLLTAALQEAIARIETLEAAVAALEGE